MIKLFIIGSFASVFLFTNLSLAADSDISETFKTARASVVSSLEAGATTVGRATTDFVNWARAHTGEATTDMNELRARIVASGTVMSGSNSKTALANLERAQKAAQDQAEKARSAHHTMATNVTQGLSTMASEAQKAVVASAVGTHKAAVAGAEAAQKAAVAGATAAHIQALSAELEISRLQANFQSLVAKFNNVTTTLDVVERSLDRSIIGAYVQDKVGALVNSNLFCHAIKRCDPSSGRTEIGIDKMKEIFPQISSKNARSGAQQYDRDKARRGAK